MSAQSQASVLVTVAIPTYNRADQLCRALASVLSQDYQRLEVLVGDNASTDHTAAVLAEHAGDPRLRSMRHDVNVGAVGNFQALLRVARGDLFMWLADDDWLSSGYVRSCVSRLTSDDPPARVSGRAVYVRNGQVVREERADLTNADPARRVTTYFRTVQGNFLYYSMSARSLATTGSEMMSRRQAFDWLYVARHLFLGRAETVDDVALYVSTYDADDAGKGDHSLGAQWYLEAFKMLFVPYDVVRDILRHPVYAPMPRRSRTLLALQCGAIAFRRFSTRPYAAAAAAMTLRRLLPRSAYRALGMLRRRLQGRF